MTTPASPKSVDWLDALSELGAGRVRAEFEAAARQAVTLEEEIKRTGAKAKASPKTQGNALDELAAECVEEPDLYPTNPAYAALMFLCEVFAPHDPGRDGGATWRLVTWNRQAYSWQAGRWKAIGEDVLKSVARDWSNAKRTIVKGQNRPYVATDQSLRELLSAVRDMTCIETDGMGKWLAPAYSEEWNVPGYRVPAPRRVLSDEEREAEGLPDPARLLVLVNGMIDVDGLIEDRVELMPPTERLFAAAPIPHPWPESATEAAQAGAMGDWYDEHCSIWMLQQKWMDAGRKVFSSVMIRDIGRAMISDLTSEKIPLLQGARGSGKGTIQEIMISIFGEAVLGGMTLDAVGDPAQIEPIEGKRAVIFPDEESTGKGSKLGTVSVLKKMGSGEILHARVLYRGAHQFRCQAVPFIFCNRIPNLRDPGGALSARYRGYMFRTSVRGTAAEDPAVKKRLILEAPKIMVHIIWEGLRPYLKDKAAGIDPLPKPDDHEQVIQLFDQQADSIGQFVSECLRPEMAKGVPGVPEGEHCSIDIGTLHQIALAWARREGKEDQVGSKSLFATNLHASIVGWGCYHRQKVLRGVPDQYRQDESIRELGPKIGRTSHWFGLRLVEGVLAELYPSADAEGIPKYGVNPRDDLDWNAHRMVVETLYRDELPPARTLPRPESPPAEGGTDA